MICKLTNQGGEKKHAVLGANYDNKSTKDDYVSAGVASKLGLAYHKLSYVFEWGNFANDGQGLCVSTVKAIVNNVPAETESVTFGHQMAEYLKIKSEFETYFHVYAGCKKIYWQNCLAHDTTGHIDLYLVFGEVGVGKKVLIAHWPQPNSGQLTTDQVKDNTYATAAANAMEGEGWTVVYVPFGGYVGDSNEHLTYLNALPINGPNAKVVVMPIAPSKDNDCTGGTCAAAKLAWVSAFAGASVVTADSEAAFGKGGAVHCQTKHFVENYGT